MDLIPAIDMLGGKVVRLRQGRYDQVTVYADDAVKQAEAFAAAGAKRLHVVDLDGARDGVPGNLETLRRIVRELPLAVQVGGGIRTAASVEAWRAAGAARVVVGTLALESPETVKALAAAWPDGIIVAVDAKDGKVVVRGWREESARTVAEVATDAEGWGAAALLFTNVSKDGTGEGPDVAATAALQRTVRATVIASGGIGSVEHLVALKAAGVRAAVCGRALYEGAFTLPEAFTALGTP